MFIYCLDVKDEAGLLIAVMKNLMGNAHISFEGNLSDYNFNQIPGASKKELGQIKRCTLFPKEDFIVLPLETETIDIISAKVSKNDRAREYIIHCQIEKNGRLEFGTYDNFSDIFTGPAISREFLERLLSKGILESFEPHT